MENLEGELIKSIHDLTGIPMSKMKQYTETFNNPLNIIEHCDVLSLTNKQKDRINALKSLISGFNHLKEFESLNKIQITSSHDARKILSGMLSHHRDREYFVTLFLDATNTVIDILTIKGEIGQCFVNNRDILSKALNHDARNLIVGHNHPGNASNPSRADIALTQNLINIFKPLDIQIHDHIIVSDLETYSMSESCDLDFNYVKGEADYSIVNISENEHDYETETNNWDFER